MIDLLCCMLVMNKLQKLLLIIDVDKKVHWLTKIALHIKVALVALVASILF